MKIYKYQLQIVDSQTIEIMGFLKILSVAIQSYSDGVESMVLYAVVDTHSPLITCINIAIVGTGNSFRRSLLESYWKFLGTHSMCNSKLMWHVWYRIGN